MEMCCDASMIRLSLRQVIVNGKSPLITEQVSDARSPTFNCNTVDWNGFNFGGTVEDISHSKFNVQKNQRQKKAHTNILSIQPQPISLRNR